MWIIIFPAIRIGLYPPLYLNNSYITYSQIAIIHWWTHSQVPSVRRRFTSWIRTSSAAARKPTGCQIVAARGPGRSNGSGLWKRRASCIPTCRLELGEWGERWWKPEFCWRKWQWYGYDMAIVCLKLHGARPSDSRGKICILTSQKSVWRCGAVSILIF